MTVHQAVWILTELLGKELRKLLVVDRPLLVLIHDIGDDLELRLQDDAKQPVTSHHRGEELRLALAANLMNAPV